MRHTSRITSELPRLFWKGEELSLKLSYAENGPVLCEVRSILTHRRKIHTGLENNGFATPMSQIPYLQHRGTLTTRTPDRLDAFTAVEAWLRAIIEAINYPQTV